MTIARRTDNKLRESINALEAMLLTQATREAVFSEATCLLMHLLEASYGFCYQCSSSNIAGETRWDFVDSLEKNTRRYI